MSKLNFSKISATLVFALWSIASIWFLLTNHQNIDSILYFFVDEYYSYWAFVVIGYALKAFVLVMIIWGALSVLFIPSFISSKRLVYNQIVRGFINLAIMAATIAVVIFLGRELYFSLSDVYIIFWIICIPLGLIILLVFAFVTFFLCAPTKMFVSWEDDGGLFSDTPFHFWHHFSVTALTAACFAGIGFILGSFHFLSIHHPDLFAWILIGLLVCIVIALCMSYEDIPDIIAVFFV